MKIDWLTVTAQVVNFLVLVWLLKRFLYQPVITAMATREQRIATRLNEASEREQQAEAERRRLRQETEALEQSREEKLAQARRAVDEEKRKQLDEARREIDRQHRIWRDELRREQEELRKTLRRKLAEAAVTIARRALADLADASLERQIATTFLHRLEGLSGEEREALVRGGGPVQVAASFDLDDDIRERLRKALKARAGIELLRDPELVCGIALTGAGHRVEWNLGDYLGDAEELIRRQLAGPADADRSAPDAA